MAVEYRANLRSMGAYLRRSEALQTATMELAADIAAVARRIAPVDSGDYRAGIRTQPRPGRDRVGAAVEATAAHSAALEFGTKRTGRRGLHVLSRAAEST